MEINNHSKNVLTGSMLTLGVIIILVLSGSVSAIDVSLITKDIDLGKDDTERFTIEIKINDGEFLPLMYTLFSFDDGNSQVTCKINADESVEGCNFITIESSEFSNLNSGQNYGYGLGYDSGNNFGYHNFGYGYGYGYGTKGNMGGSGYGLITYKIIVDGSKLPSSFRDEEINVIAKVFGGNTGDNNYFIGTSKFDLIGRDRYQQPLDCIEDWYCGGWSACLSEEQERTCSDLNSCGTTNFKPIEEQSCSLPTYGTNENPENQLVRDFETTSQPQSSISSEEQLAILSEYVILFLTIVLAFTLFALTLFVRRR